MLRFVSLYALGLPLALLVSIPLACFAVITTIIASSILTIRVTFVYLELGFAIILQYIFHQDDPYNKLSSGHASQNITLDNSPSITPPIKRRSRRFSNTSATSALTTAASAVSLPLPRSIGPARDFEGVGGWRLDLPSDDEMAWTKINSRLELPAESPRRHHQRSLTGGSYTGEQREWIGSTELDMRGFSPNTKSMSGASGMDGYFAMAAGNCNVQLKDCGENTKCGDSQHHDGVRGLVSSRSSWIMKGMV